MTYRPFTSTKGIWAATIYLLTATHMSHNMEVVLFGAVLLLLALNTRRTKTRQTTRIGALSIASMIVQSLFFLFGLTVILLGVFVEQDLPLLILDTVRNYIPIPLPF